MFHWMLQKEEQVQNLNLQMPKTPQIVKINTNIKLDSTLTTDVKQLLKEYKDMSTWSY
jgi:hypothetical protein